MNNKIYKMRLNLLLMLGFFCNMYSYAGVIIENRYVLLPGQFPSSISKLNPHWVYIFIATPLKNECRANNNRFFGSVKTDTIINYKIFIDSLVAAKSPTDYFSKLDPELTASIK